MFPLYIGLLTSILRVEVFQSNMVKMVKYNGPHDPMEFLFIMPEVS